MSTTPTKDLCEALDEFFGVILTGRLCEIEDALYAAHGSLVTRLSADSQYLPGSELARKHITEALDLIDVLKKGVATR